MILLTGQIDPSLVLQLAISKVDYTDYIIRVVKGLCVTPDLSKNIA